ADPDVVPAAGRIAQAHLRVEVAVAVVVVVPVGRGRVHQQHRVALARHADVEVVPAERGQVEGEVRARGHPAAAAGRGRLDVVAGAQLAAAAGDQLEALRRVQLLAGK